MKRKYSIDILGNQYWFIARLNIKMSCRFPENYSYDGWYYETEEEAKKATVGLRKAGVVVPLTLVQGER